MPYVIIYDMWYGKSELWATAKYDMFMKMVSNDCKQLHVVYIVLCKLVCKNM